MCRMLLLVLVLVWLMIGLRGGEEGKPSNSDESHILFNHFGFNFMIPRRGALFLSPSPETSADNVDYQRRMCELKRGFTASARFFNPSLIDSIECSQHFYTDQAIELHNATFASLLHSVYSQVPFLT